LLQHFQMRTLQPLGLKNWLLATRAAGALVSYLRETQEVVAEQLTRLTTYRAENFMTLDAQAVRSLEIFENHTGAPSLLSALDRTRTAMGGRLLRRWLRQPLLDLAELTRRQEHVAWFQSHAKERAELFAAFETVFDLERLSSRARACLATPQEMLTLKQGLETIPRIRAILQRESRRFGELLGQLPLCDKAAALIHKAIPEELPRRNATVGNIREGFSEELDELRALLRDGKTYLAEMEQRERARTGIKSLRVGFNKVFGYFIEVTRPNLHLVPADYTRKQTLAASERFITLELKEHESLVVNAQDRIAELEASLFRHVSIEVGKNREEILSAAASIAYLDAIASFSDVADVYSYIRPVITDSPELKIHSGRHPVLERIIEDNSYVPNDTELGGEGASQIALVTGPNMSGKSSYLRQTALIVLMAQVGSFVPAQEATIGICDRIFTRIGLYDRLGSGESTFMTEMVETAQILHQATPRSLILLDELGRGTSTYDGLAVARAVLEYIHNHPHIRSKTLFATHYHELTELANVLPRVQNLYVEIAEEGNELVFLYKVSPGSATKSYGVYAAKLAGLPRPVVRRAEELLGEYEAEGHQPQRGMENSVRESVAIDTRSAQATEIIHALLKLDLDTISPVEALTKLYELRNRAEAEKVSGKELPQDESKSQVA
jgi:DNA mismatch repair protein MutS